MRANDMSKLVRPWWRGRDGDHVKADCPLLAADSCAAEGSGWFNLDLDRLNGELLCPQCFAWDAECTLCGASLECEIGTPMSRVDAQTWTNDHVCMPTFTFTPVVRPAAPPRRMRGQETLFALERTR